MGSLPSRLAGLVVYRLVVYRRVGHRRVGHRLARHQGGAPGGERGSRLEVLLVHPGGPYWARCDEGWWSSIPKGEVGEGEDELSAAKRELTEELGLPASAGKPIALGKVVQAGGKHVRAWAVAGDLDVSAVSVGTFELEWPLRSGRVQTFPEVDRAGWFDLEEARVKLLAGQLPLLDRLELVVAATQSSDLPGADSAVQEAANPADAAQRAPHAPGARGSGTGYWGEVRFR